MIPSTINEQVQVPAENTLELTPIGRGTVTNGHEPASDLANAIGAVRAKRRELRGDSDACKLPIYLR
jgi:hypothetical protein